MERSDIRDPHFAELMRATARNHSNSNFSVAASLAFIRPSFPKWRAVCGGVSLMYYAADRELAKRAVTELRAARLAEGAATLAALQRLRNAVASERTDDIPRIDAWVSIRKLYDAYRSGAEEDMKPLWQDAIARTAAWHESLR